MARTARIRVKTYLDPDPTFEITDYRHGPNDLYVSHGDQAIADKATWQRDGIAFIASLVSEKLNAQRGHVQGPE